MIFSISRIVCLTLIITGALTLAGCGGSSSGGANLPPIIVNSLEDIESPEEGTVTLRSAIAQAVSDQRIEFDETLNGGTIHLEIVGEEHSILKGEVMGFEGDPTEGISILLGYFDRDYGASALFAQKNVSIDASSLTSGITITWSGTENARIMGVNGSLTMNNVTLTGGRSFAVDIAGYNPDDPYEQPWSLGRGGALAVWGTATLTDCTIYGNSCLGDFDSSRDRGAFGGGVYADMVQIDRCIISGNSVVGAGAAGGGVYSVGGVEQGNFISNVDDTTISDNRISAIFTYGGGIYSDGGGIGNAKHLNLTNCTIARNIVEPAGPAHAPYIPSYIFSFLLGMGYWRGGAVYASNGLLEIKACTIAENEVWGVPRTDSRGRRNLAGAVAATVGNAHAVEKMTIGHSIITGNTVHEMNTEYAETGSYPHDVFTGSMMYFQSEGYNRFGVIDFSQILSPVGEPGWDSLCRRHYPKVGDEENVPLAQAVNTTSGIVTMTDIPSATREASGSVFYYQPGTASTEQIPNGTYTTDYVLAEYNVLSGDDTFLHIMLQRVQAYYSLTDYAATFETDFETFLQSVDTDETTTDITEPYEDPEGNPILTLEDTLWFGPAETWPAESENHPYMEFWYQLHDDLAGRDISGMGYEVLGDEAWDGIFDSGALSENTNIIMTVNRNSLSVVSEVYDQLGTGRRDDNYCDIGAIEN